VERSRERRRADGHTDGRTPEKIEKHEITREKLIGRCHSAHTLIETGKPKWALGARDVVDITRERGQPGLIAMHRIRVLRRLEDAVSSSGIAGWPITYVMTNVNPQTRLDCPDFSWLL
jgi:hypothetical protein